MCLFQVDFHDLSTLFADGGGLFIDKAANWGPVEYEKQLEQLLQLVTTLSISHAQNRARSGYAMARKGAMKWNLHASRVTILLHGKQQNTTLRLGHSCRLSLRSVVHCCKSCSSCFP
jgi:hypothetical protein